MPYSTVPVIADEYDRTDKKIKEHIIGTQPNDSIYSHKWLNKVSKPLMWAVERLNTAFGAAGNAVWYAGSKALGYEDAAYVSKKMCKSNLKVYFKGYGINVFKNADNNLAVGNHSYLYRGSDEFLNTYGPLADLTMNGIMTAFIF